MKKFLEAIITITLDILAPTAFGVATGCALRGNFRDAAIMAILGFSVEIYGKLRQ